MTDREFLIFMADQLENSTFTPEYLERLRDMATRPVIAAGKLLIVEDPGKCIAITNEYLTAHLIYIIGVRGTTGILKTLHLLVHKDKVANIISTLQLRCLADEHLKEFMCIESMERINSILVE